MAWRSSGVVCCRCDELTATQVFQCRVGGAFGKSGAIGNCAHTGTNRAPFVSCSMGVKMQIHQIGRRLLVVADQIAHEHVEDVIVDGNGSFEARISR